MDHYAAYDSSVVHTHYQDHKNLDPLITNYPATAKKQEAAVVQVNICSIFSRSKLQIFKCDFIQGFTMDTLQASNWPNGKAVNDLPTVKVGTDIVPVTKKDIVYVMATGLEDVIWASDSMFLF